MIKERAYMLKGKTTHWSTPKAIYDSLDAEFTFDFDPCPLHADFDGLAIRWRSRNFVNPPHDNIAKWVEKAYTEWQYGKLVVMLLPVRTDTYWFHQYIYGQAETRFLKGRLRFGNSKNSAPFPSMIVIYREKTDF